METKLLQLFSNQEDSKNKLQLSGELYMSGCSLFGTEVSLFENGILENKFICCANGYFYFQLNYNKQYMIEISKELFESKSILIDTTINEVSQTNRHFEFGVMLHRYDLSSGMNQKSIPVIKYSSEFDRFEIEPYNKKTNTIAS